VAGYHQGHVPYDAASLARALQTGVASDGRVLRDLMPRYELGGEAMADLQAWLATLGEGPFPGVSDTQLQFATIVTPDADPVQRDAMLQVLGRFFSVQGEVIAAETRPLRSSHEIKYRVTRQWQLHVWELRGAPQTWERQLEDYQASQAVFAVISGIGRGTWAPVHSFSEKARVPCLFPNVDAPVVSEDDFYPVYFSRGVLLEADLLAGWMGRAPESAGRRRLVSVYREGDAGASGAEALAAQERARGMQVASRPLPAAPTPGDLAQALEGIGPGDTLVLWLRPADLQALPARPPAAGAILVSGWMGGLESAPLPAAWRALARLSYPADLPERRMARMNFPNAWFRVQHIPLVPGQVQVDTYLACVVTAETLGHVLDSFVPDYLVERLEMMVSRRLANAYYPRLGLAPGQRFASKGGFIVHFADGPEPAKIVADTEWTVP
jgi:hypothetical protein